MNGTEISRNPATKLAELVVTQRTSANMAKVAAKLNKEYFEQNPDSTQDMFQAWVTQVEENGLCRLVNAMSKTQKKIMNTEAPRIMEELGKVRGSADSHTVWLPEKYPAKRPIPGSKEVYVEPAEGVPKPYNLQVKTKNVLQNHPEVYDDNTGDSFHIVESGTGLAPSGKLYSDPKEMPHHAQLKNVTPVKQIFARIGGTTTLSPGEVSTIDPSPDYVKNKLKGKKKEWMQALRSVGHHIRSKTDVMKTVDKITGKYDGVKSDLFAHSGKVWLAFRDGTSVAFDQAGAALTECNLVLEWVDPLPYDRKVVGSGIPQIEGKVPVVTVVSSLNFGNVFGFDMVKALGSPSTGAYSKKPYSRIVFNFKGGHVPVRTPKVLWEQGSCPLWQANLDQLFAAGPDSEEPSDTLHKVDGAVFHGVGGEQDLGKFYKTVDINRKIAMELNIPWDVSAENGTDIREYVAYRGPGGDPAYKFLRMRDPDNGGTKYRPNSMQNIHASALSPDVWEIITFLREVDYHDRSLKLMNNLEEECKTGMTRRSWEDAVARVGEEDTTMDLSELLMEHYSEIMGETILPEEGEYVDIFEKYFLRG